MTEDILADFEKESLYERDRWFVHRVVTLDAETRTVVVELDTTRIGRLVDAQKVTPGHPRHLPAAAAIQMTGSIGQLYAVYVKGLRATEGWSGFGTHIHKARFPNLGIIGPPVLATATCVRERMLRGTWFLDFDIQMVQDERIVYSARQTAAWVHQPST